MADSTLDFPPAWNPRRCLLYHAKRGFSSFWSSIDVNKSYPNDRKLLRATEQNLDAADFYARISA